MRNMLNCFTTPGPLRPFKVINADRSRKVGLAETSKRRLRKKVASTFNLPRSTLTLVLEDDGTLVEDDGYFELLEDHTLLMALGPEENWTTSKTAIDEFMENVGNNLELQGLELALARLLEGPNADQWFQDVSRYIEASTEGTSVAPDSRDDHPEWFEGLTANVTSKEGYMKQKAKNRVRGYYTVLQREMGRNTSDNNKDVLDNFRNMLQTNDYHANFFARASGSPEQFCDDSGRFECGGLFDADQCNYKNHFINPYGNKENRILFKTWELDHLIEKKREVIPLLLSSTKKIPRNKQLNYEYFYSLLFTRANLKLVHKVCHDTSAHASKKCEIHKVYVDRVV